MSRQAFVEMLNQRTLRFGRAGKILADTFGRSFEQWCLVRHELEKLCKVELFTCPACTPHMLAVSVDGNRKLYRFKNTVSKDEEVESFVDYLHKKTKHAPGKGMCGGTQWTAAKETLKKSNSRIDEEGLEVAVCRPLLRALNMYRGEIFAYPLYLHRELTDKNVEFLCSDVACHYFPYLNKVSKDCPELQDLLHTKPFLSVWHAKAHTYKCELILQASFG
ncbi:hypothetical protein AAFF_G00236930 [Aldrovandia affinis]|uniref:Uncharacterized protein n=1 Tax=Aldrovandia affinis TaxID=143900 RepID=A0AAD7REN9_9TELE|nr:hypothetical protein AAFF_G00236930 [Aldrovandia affinis]